MSRPPILAMALTLLAGCQVYPSPVGLEPLEQPQALEAAPPRVNATIPSDRHRGDFEARGVATTPVVEPPAVPGAAGQPGEITLNFVDTDIREIARTILGSTLKLNYTIDPNIHGTGSIETTAPLPRSALLPALETLLNENGATLVEKNGIYAVVPIAVGAASNRASGADAIGAGTQVVALRYAAAKDLAKTLEPFVAEGGKITADIGRNALIVSGDPAVRQTLIGLIRAFDIDVLAGHGEYFSPSRRRLGWAGSICRLGEHRHQPLPIDDLVVIEGQVRVRAEIVIRPHSAGYSSKNVRPWRARSTSKFAGS